MHSQSTADPAPLWGILSVIFSLFLLSLPLEASADIPPPRELFSKQIFTASPVPLERLTPQLVNQMRVRTRQHRVKRWSYFSRGDTPSGVESIREENEQKHLLVQDLRVTLTLYPLWATLGVETRVSHIDHESPSDHHDLALHIRDESPPFHGAITLSELLLSYHAQWDQSPLQVVPHTYTTRDEERPLYLSFFRVRAPLQQGHYHRLKYTFTTLYPHDFSKSSSIKDVFFGHRQLNVNDRGEPMYTSVDLKIVGESAQLSLSDRPRWAGQEVYPILPPLLDWSSIQTWTELLSASGLASKPVEEISNSLRFSLITLSLLDLAHREESDPERWWHALCLLDELSHSNTDGFGEHARSLMSSILPQELRLERRGQTSDEWAPEPLSQRSQVSSLSELLRGPDPDELEAQFAQLIHKVQQDKDRAQGTPSDEYELQAWRDLFGDQTQNLASLSFEESLSRRTLHFLSRDPRLCSGGCTQALEWLNMRNRRIEYAYRLIWSSSGFLCLIGLFALRWRRELPLRVDRSRSPRFKECFLFPLSTPDARRDLFKGSLMLIIPPLGWVMNMGHRLDVVSRIFHDQAPYHRGFSPLGKTFLRGLKALIAILIYLSPAIGAAALGAYLNQCWLLIFSALLFLLAVYILPGGMTYNAAHEDISYLYRPDRAALRAFSGGLTYLWAWVISLCAILLSPLGLLLFGIGFFYTSVWAWMVVGYAFSRALSLKEHTQSAD